MLCEDALEVIKREDEEKTLFYLDPPYVPGTRAVTDAYQHEMDVPQHAALFRGAQAVPGTRHAFRVST